MRPPKHNNILVRGYNFKIIYFNNNCHFNVNTCIILKGNDINLMNSTFEEFKNGVKMKFEDISAMKKAKPRKRLEPQHPYKPGSHGPFITTTELLNNLYITQ